MTQVRFISKKGRKLADNYYARADGTRTYFFSEEHMAELATNAGFEIVLNKYDTRELRNRKRQVRIIASRHIPNGFWIMDYANSIRSRCTVCLCKVHTGSLRPPVRCLRCQHPPLVARRPYPRLLLLRLPPRSHLAHRRRK